MNPELFKYYVARAGLNMAKVADLVGIDVSTLHRKAKGTTEFTRSEILLLRQCLQLSLPESENLFFDLDFAEMQKRKDPNEERSTTYERT